MEDTPESHGVNGAPAALETEAPPEPAPPPAVQSSSLRQAPTWGFPRGNVPHAPRRVRFWTASLAAALVVAVGGLGFLYLDDTSFQAADRKLTSENQSLQAQNQTLQNQLATTQTNLTATLGELARVRAQLEHPTLTIWNVPQQILNANWYLAGGAPDAFTYHLVATSSGPMSVSILTLEDFAKAIQCIENGVGTTHWCMHHSGSPVRTFQNVKSVNYDFHGAEGCAGYLVVFTAASRVTVTPNVSVTYNPASSSTGSCAR